MCQDASFALFKAAYSCFEHQVHPLCTEPRMNKRRHILVKGCQQLVQHLDDRDLNAHFAEIFRQFEPDESTTRQHGAPRLFFLYKIADLQGILHCAKRKQTLGLQPGHGRTNRPCPRRKYQLVIGFLKFRARLQVSYRDSLAVPMNGDDLVMDVHINIKTAFEALGSLQSKQIAIFNNTADVIRQSAVGIRYISRPLKYNNLSGLIQPPETRRGACSSCNAADNDYFHLPIPPLFVSLLGTVLFIFQPRPLVSCINCMLSSFTPRPFWAFSA